MKLTNYNVACDLKTVENYFINNGTNISNKKLQKLLYFAQAWFVALNNNEDSFNSSSCIYKLFEEDIEAWRHGPIIPDSYYRYKIYGTSYINKKQIVDEVISIDLKNFLDDILTVYDKYNADNLESISHQHQPWQIKFKVNQRNVIDLQDMFQFYINEI